MVHGDGLISMQFRRVAGGQTDEVQAPVRNPASVRLQRTGDNFVFWVRERGEPYVRYGTVLVSLQRRVLVGLAVCSHDAAVDETALFSNVDMKEFVPTTTSEVLESTLEIMNIETGVRKPIYRMEGHFEAPNWAPDGQTLYFNSKGRIYRIPLEGGAPQVVPTDYADRCNNDHGLSPDGRTLAISHHEDDVSYIYTVPVEGGAPKKITPLGPSYWHGWAPDGQSVVYCAEREGEFDVYSQALSGGDEVRLTSAPGLDDGPEYAPDGSAIFFNSERTGTMRIWVMDPNGGNQRQVTSDEAFADWFPHPSPDGKWLVMLSYDASVQGHPANKEVALRLMPRNGGEPRILTRILGGQGTINVPSWAPDSKHFAFVSYRWIRPAP
jgi:Tol biopolymer transport system component